jgi:nicotinamide mononucleotide (NMN) deamidase PncC
LLYIYFILNRMEENSGADACIDISGNAGPNGRDGQDG